MNKTNLLLKIIIFLVIAIIIIIFILLKLLNNNYDISTKDKNNTEEDVLIESETELSKINDIKQYYNGLKHIKEYINNSNNELYDSIFYSQKGYYKEFDITHALYIYDGELLSDEVVKEYAFGIIVDYDNQTYKIVEGNSIEQINLMNLDYDIENDDNNGYEYYYVEDEDIARNIFNNFKFNLKYHSSYIYENLNEEYKEKRFDSNIEDFNQYVIDMQEKIENSVITGYKIDNISENETKYIIENSNKNQFAFIQDENLDYTIMLDTYTILDNDFRSKYNSLSNESKTHTDIDMFIKMINTKDYAHAYEKLDETFRENNFGTDENFAQYISNNFYENNFLNVDTIEERDGIYIVKTTITDSISSAAETMEKQFIVKLGEGTDFIMSFNID